MNMAEGHRIFEEADTVLRHVLLVRMERERIGGVELSDQQRAELQRLGPKVPPGRIQAALDALRAAKHKEMAECFQGIAMPVPNVVADHEHPFLLYNQFRAAMRLALGQVGFSRAQLVALLEERSFLGWRHHETRVDYEAWGQREGLQCRELYARDLLVWEALSVYSLDEFKALFLDDLIEEQEQQLRGHCHVRVLDGNTVTISFV